MIRGTLAWRPGLLARNTAYATGWNLWRIALQALNLIALARLLGPEGYGILAGTTALFATCAQFVGLGTGIALVRDTARNPCARPKRFAETRTIYLFTGLIFFLIAWALGLWILSDKLSVLALAALAAAELAAVPTIMPIAYRLQSEERMSTFGLVMSVPPTVRLIAIVILLWLGSPSITRYAIIYLGLMSLSSIIVNTMFGHAGRPDGSVVHRLKFIREGLPYVLPSASNTAGNELDKTIVLQFAGESAAGPYAAAYRIAQAAVLPVHSLVLTIVPRLFRSSATDLTAHALRPYFVATACYGLLAACAVFLAAPVIPLLLGADFAPGTWTMRLFSVYVITNAQRQLVMAAMTTSDSQRQRNLTEVASTAISLLLSLFLVPTFGISAAVLALVVGDLSAIGLGASYLRANLRIRDPQILGRNA